MLIPSASLLTWNISPTTKTIATHATMSAWFWMTNSWLKMGGFLLDDLLLTAMATAVLSITP